MSESKKDKGLTINQILMNTLDPEHAMDPVIIKFLNSYIGTFSASDASKAAGIKTESGKRILRKADVQAAITLINETMGRKANFDAGEILERTNEIAQYNALDVFNDNGTVKRFTEIPPELGRVIKSMKVRETFEKDINGMEVWTGYIKEITFHDKLKGLEMIGKYDGVFRERVDHTHEIGTNMAQYLLASERQANERQIPDLNLTKDAYQNAFALEASKVRVKGEDDAEA